MQILCFHLLEGPHPVVHFPQQRPLHLSVLRMVHQVVQVAVHQRPVDLPDGLFVLSRQGPAQELPEDGRQQPLFQFPVPGHSRFVGMGYIGQVAFRGIVEQGSQSHPVAAAPGQGFPGRGDTVLAHGIKRPAVPVAPAQKTQGMGDILDAEGLRPRVQRVELQAGEGGDGPPAHLVPLPVTAHGFLPVGCRM